MTLLNVKRFAFFLAICSCAYTEAKTQWIDLFNGKDLTGWKIMNGTAPIKVEDGCIVGTCVVSPNTFLCTEKTYSDFILEAEMLLDTAMNSGIQFRSQSKPNYQNGHVYGYQAEADPTKRAWSGGIYDECRRLWIYNLKDNDEGRKAFKNGEWNKYRIEAIGTSIRIYVNGISTANLIDNYDSTGFIGLQVHGVYGERPWMNGVQVRWRNIRILTSNLLTESYKNIPLAKELNLIPNTLSDVEKAEGWQLLFDGVTTNGWRRAYQDSFPKQGWAVNDGVITVFSSNGAESRNGGDIVTVNEYGDFELTLEFKITEGANSGIKYYVTEQEKGNPGSAIGLEYQILDDERHPDAKQGNHEGSRTISSLYDLIKAKNKKSKPVGEWNKARIVSKKGHVEHWLNGDKVVEYERGSVEFRKLVSKSKYKERENFGEAPKGHILLQDHGNEVSFRNIKIKNL